MTPSNFWRNFDLNVELHSAGAFIYDGLRTLDQTNNLEYEDEVFGILYDLAVGLERLLKIAIVLAEHVPGVDQAAFEKSLVTHNHQKLVQRLRALKTLNLNTEHHALVALLARFYVTYRYDRYCLGSLEKRQLIFDEFKKFASRGTAEKIELIGPFATYEMAPIRQYLGSVCRKICSQLYRIISETATANGLFTYELRSESKAYKIFGRKEYDFRKEDIAWKELLVYLMKVGDAGTLGKLVEAIEPLDFDPGDMNDFVKAFREDAKLTEIIDTVETLREDVSASAGRDELVELIGSSGFFIAHEDITGSEGTDEDDGIEPEAR